MSGKGKLRNCSGATLVELAPSLFLIILIGFLPMLDLLAFVGSYTGCTYLNKVQLESLRTNLAITTRDGKTVISSNLVPQALAQANSETNQFASSALGKMIHAQIPSLAASDVAIQPCVGTTWSNGAAVQGASFMVTVTTRITCLPFIAIPFFNNVPALGGPTPIKVTSASVVENVVVQ